MNIALIAHDNKKADMVAFVSKRLPFFNREDVTIITTGTTGKHCKHAGIKNLQTVLSGPIGGDAQIAVPYKIAPHTFQFVLFGDVFHEHQAVVHAKTRKL